MDCYKHNKPMKMVREWPEHGSRWRKWVCPLCKAPMDTALERVMFEPPSQEDLDAWLGGIIV